MSALPAASAASAAKKAPRELRVRDATRIGPDILAAFQERAHWKLADLVDRVNQPKVSYPLKLGEIHCFSFPTMLRNELEDELAP